MPRPFVTPGTKTHFAPDCPVSVTHVRLDLEPNLNERSLKGEVTLSLVCRRDDLAAVELDAVDMQFSSVSVDGQPAAGTHYDGKRLRVALARRRARGDELSLRIGYHCAPLRGLYFIGPDEAHPNRPLECWTQGQDGTPLLLSLRGCADSQGDQRGSVHGPRRPVRALERGPTRGARARRCAQALALRPRRAPTRPIW